MPATRYPYTSSPLGSKVGPVPMPSPFSDLSSLYPNLGQTNAAASSAIMSNLRGELSPETIANIQNAAAAFGVSSGMPGSGLQMNRGLRDIGLTTEGLQQQGLRDYESFLPVLSSTQTVRPETQVEVNTQNALNAAAPEPNAAATYAEQLYNKYLNKTRNPAGGTEIIPIGPDGRPMLGYTPGKSTDWWQR